MNDRIDPSHARSDEGRITHRADGLSVRRSHEIEPDDLVTSDGQEASERLAKMPRRSGDQHPHADGLAQPASRLSVPTALDGERPENDGQLCDR